MPDPKMPSSSEWRKIDIHVGRKVAMLRSSAGKTVAVLAGLMGCSAGHLEKIETGEDRLAAREMLDLSAAFNVQIGYFFADEHLRPLH